MSDGSTGRVDEFLDSLVRVSRGITQACPTDDQELLQTRCGDLQASIRETGTLPVDEFVEFAIDTIRAAETSRVGAQLCLDLSRLHPRICEFLGDSDRFQEVAYAALEDPSDHTPSNDGFVRDLVFNALLWEAEKALQGGGVANLISFLKGQQYLEGEPGGFTRRSIIKDLCTFKLGREPRSLEQMRSAFKGDVGITKDLDRLLREAGGPSAKGTPAEG